MTRHLHFKKVLNSGFTLVEIMIALVLGLFLISALIAIFSANIRSYEFSRSLSYMQSNARFAIGQLQEGLRMAGYQGCSNTASTPMTIVSTSAPTDNFQATRILVSRIGASGWVPSTPYGYIPTTGVGAPAVGTDALLVQFASPEQGSLVSDMSGNTSTIEIKENGNLQLETGELAVIGNCSSATLFTVGTTSNTAESATIKPVEALPIAYSVRAQSNAQSLSASTPTNTETSVHRFISRLYYVGDTGRTNINGDVIRALFLQTWPYSTSNPPVELVEGVEQLLIGVSMAGGNPSEFSSALDVGFDSRNALSVRFGVLMASIERFGEGDSDIVYTVGGQYVPVENTDTMQLNMPTYSADNRVRRPFSTVVKIRNTINAN